MNYVVGDIHNENRRLQMLLEEVSFGAEDRLVILGDLFDRGEAADPDPVGLYFTVLGLEDRVTVVRGNHDQWLANYIDYYFSLPERKRLQCESYHYNSFDLIKKRLTFVDMQELSSRIRSWPLQAELEINGITCLFAHAQASPLGKREADEYYLLGDEASREHFIRYGIEGCVTFCGHIGTSNFRNCGGQYLDEEGRSIWRNEAQNVYMMDCGCGFASGRLACLCIETGERWYV